MTYNFVNLIKAFAAILITNSHFGTIYPEKLSILAFGGALGNAMFFICSGFLINKVEKGYTKWIWHKLSRIYPALWIMLLLIILTERPVISLKKILEWFIFPTKFWFIGAIIGMYSIAYIILKYFPNQLNRIIAMQALIYFVVLYGFVDYKNFDIEYNYLKCLYYIIAFFIGIRIRQKLPLIVKSLEDKWFVKWISLALAGAGFVCYGASSVIIKAGGATVSKLYAYKYFSMRKRSVLCAYWMGA